MMNVDRRRRARLHFIQNEEDEIMEPVVTAGPRATSSNIVNDFPAVLKSFLCPLTLSVMFDPVLDPQGNSYERVFIDKWLQSRSISPISRQPLSADQLVPNLALKDLIHRFMGEEWVVRKEQALREYATPSSGQQGRHRFKVQALLDEMACDQGLGGLWLKLNEHGSAAFRNDSLMVVIDVPETSGYVVLHTRELLVQPELLSSVKDRLLELNFLQIETRGGCLGVCKTDGEQEVVLSYRDHIDGLTAQDLQNIILNFVDTALELRQKFLANGDDYNKSTAKMVGTTKQTSVNNWRNKNTGS